METCKNNYSRPGNMSPPGRRQEDIKRTLFIENYLRKNFGAGNFFSKLNTYGCSSWGVSSDY